MNGEITIDSDNGAWAGKIVVHWTPLGRDSIPNRYLELGNDEQV